MTVIIHIFPLNLRPNKRKTNHFLIDILELFVNLRVLGGQPIRERSINRSQYVFIRFDLLQRFNVHVNPCYLLHLTSRNEGLVQSTSSLSKTRMHPPSACFLGGLRMYKIVLLGEGGVGKSGKFVHGLTSRLTEGIREQTLVKGNSVDR